MRGRDDGRPKDDKRNLKPLIRFGLFPTSQIHGNRGIAKQQSGYEVRDVFEQTN